MNTVEDKNKKPNKALAVMGERLSVDANKLKETIKKTIFKSKTDVSDEEIIAFVVKANEYALNPFTNEIYAFPGKGGGITTVVSVDGWIRICLRNPNFNGITFQIVPGEGGKPFSCTASIRLKSIENPIEATEYYSECYRDAGPWNSHPSRMLRHKALIQCARIAFGVSGIMDPEEARDIVGVTPRGKYAVARPVFENSETRRELFAAAAHASALEERSAALDELIAQSQELRLYEEEKNQ